MSEHYHDIAVVIPAYNAESTLASTLESAFTQRKVSEIVVVDDGSQDGTLNVARRFEPKIRVLTGPNAGVSAARNRGAMETSSPWLLFLDADDLLEEGTLEARVQIADEQDADVVICDWRDLHESGAGVAKLGPVRNVDWSKMAEDAEIATAVSVWATTAAILYKRSLFQKIGGFRSDLPVIQDARFLFDAAFHGARIVHAPHLGARYRIVQGSLSRRDPARFWLDVLVNGEQIEALWRARGTLSREQIAGLATIYEHACRGLFEARHVKYFDAVRKLKSLGASLTSHARFVSPVASVLGISAATHILKVARRIIAPFSVYAGAPSNVLPLPPSK